MTSNLNKCEPGPTRHEIFDSEKATVESYGSPILWYVEVQHKKSMCWSKAERNRWNNLQGAINCVWVIMHRKLDTLQCMACSAFRRTSWLLVSFAASFCTYASQMKGYLRHSKVHGDGWFSHCGMFSPNGGTLRSSMCYGSLSQLSTATRGHVQSIQINPSQIAIDTRPSAWLVVQSLFTLQTCDWHWQCEKNNACHPLPPNASGKVPGAQKSARAVCDGQIPSPNHIQLHFHSPKRNSGFVLDLYSLLGTIFFGCFRFGGWDSPNKTSPGSWWHQLHISDLFPWLLW